MLHLLLSFWFYAFPTVFLSSSARTMQQQDKGRKRNRQDLAQGYRKTTGYATNSGPDNEVALCSLFFLRTLRVSSDFFLASNYAPAGKFDDVVIFYRLEGDSDTEYRAVFLQAKHKDKRNTLTPSQLKGYLESFMEIKDLWEQPLVINGRVISLNGVFLVHYTNSGCAVDKAVSDVTDLPDLQEFLNTGGRLLRILEAKEVGLPEGQDTSDFLGKLLLCTQQMSVETADEFLKDELSKMLGLTSVDDDLISELKRVVKAWRDAKGDGRFLTADSEEWKGILQIQLRRMNGDTLAVDHRMNLAFTREALQEMDIASHNMKMMWIPVTDKHQASFTRVRLLRARSESVVLDAEYLESHWEEVEALWGKSVCLTVAVDLTNYPRWEEPQLLQRLQMAAMADEGRHLVVVATEQPTSGGWNIVEPRDSWSALDAVTQRRLLSVKVQLQGVADVEVRGIVGSSVGDVMTDKVIQSLSGTDAALRLGEAMPPPLNYYVPRCLQRTSLRTITYQSLENTNTLMCSVWNFPSSIKYKIVFFKDLEEKIKIEGLTFLDDVIYDSDIRNLCCKFRVKGVKGKGESEGFTGEVTEYLPFTWICEDRVVVVEGLPGVGKSSFVTAMCSSVKEEFPECWVLRVDMARDTQYLKGADFTSTSDVVEFLLKALPTDSLERHLLEHALRVSGNVFLFLDAFDEISPDYTDKCCRLLKGIAKGVRYRQMVVTTRPVTTKDVQEVLESEAFTLPVFSRKEQTLFLTQFFVSNGKNIDEGEITSFQEIAGDVIEIPLLCKMSAEVLLNSQVQSVFKYNDPWRRVLLYQLFVEQSVNHRITEKFGLEASMPGVRKLLESIRVQHLRNLLGLAVRKLMPELSNHYDGEPEEKLGLVVNTGDSVDFEHRTFAEFFLGRWLSVNFKSRPLQRDVFFEDRYQFVMATLSWSLFEDCPLHLAVARGNLEAVRKELLESPGTTDRGGRSALHVAAMTRECSREVLELLIAAGEDLNRKDAILEASVVNYAEPVRNWELVDIMLEKGVKLENFYFITDEGLAKKVLVQAIKRDLGNFVKYILTLKNQLLHVKFNFSRDTLLHIAVLYNSTNVLKLLIALGLETNVKNEYEETALLLAAREGHLDSVKFLIESGGDINIIKKDGQTALHFAAREGHLDTVKFLIESGGDINKINKDGQTALHFAARGWYWDIVKFLIESGGDINIINNYGETVLHLAAIGGHLDTVKFLIESGGDINKINNRGESVLHVAAFGGHLDTVKFLIESGGDINKINNDGQTALHFAARGGHLETVKFLIESGGDINKINKDGQTALHFAAFEGHLDTVKFLIESGGDLNKINKDGQTALHFAPWGGHLDTVKFLIESGGDINKIDNYGETALHFAACGGHLETVKFLIESGGDINKIDEDGQTVLHLAASGGHLNTVKFLIESGGDINKIDNDGETVLHLAAREGHLDTVKFLIESGGDIKVINNDGVTAVTLADYSGHSDVVDFLTKYK